MIEMILMQIKALFHGLRIIQNARLRTPTRNIQLFFERDRDREVPLLERERDYPNQYDEPEVQRDPEYPFQDFNYGP